MKLALFLTTEREPARALLARARTEWPGAAITAFVCDDDRAALAAELVGCDVMRDKPVGGKLRFLRGLRAARYDLLVAAWHGGERFQPLRVAALLAGARRVLVHDEKDRLRAVSWYLPWTWAGHALGRLAQLQPLTLVRVAVGFYRWTVGAVLAGLWLLLFAAVRPRLPRR